MNDQQRIKELEKGLARLKGKIIAPENWEQEIRSLDSFTDEVKIQIFHSLYKHALRYLTEYMTKGYQPKYGKVSLYEQTLEKMLGSDVWDLINQN